MVMEIERELRLEKATTTLIHAGREAVMPAHVLANDIRRKGGMKEGGSFLKMVEGKMDLQLGIGRYFVREPD
jgi:hypothetical protein